MTDMTKITTPFGPLDAETPKPPRPREWWVVTRPKMFIAFCESEREAREIEAKYYGSESIHVREVLDE